MAGLLDSTANVAKVSQDLGALLAPSNHTTENQTHQCWMLHRGPVNGSCHFEEKKTNTHSEGIAATWALEQLETAH